MTMSDSKKEENSKAKLEYKGQDFVYNPPKSNASKKALS